MAQNLIEIDADRWSNSIEVLLDGHCVTTVLENVLRKALSLRQQSNKVRLSFWNNNEEIEDLVFFSVIL